MGDIGEAYSDIRTELAAEDATLLPDTCRLIVGEDDYEGTPCRFYSASGNIDGAPYRIQFAWGSPAVIGAAAVIDAIDGRPQLILQLVEPVDSSMGLWQEWRATSAPIYGRANVGI